MLTHVGGSGTYAGNMNKRERELEQELAHVHDLWADDRERMQHLLSILHDIESSAIDITRVGDHTQRNAYVLWGGLPLVSEH